LIVLDTNVISELVRPDANASVLGWARGIAEINLATTAVNEAELRFGIARMAPGRRRSDLKHAIDKALDRRLLGRVLPLDRPAAVAFAEFVAARQAAGRPVKTADAMIAAIARAHGATLLATRDVDDFEGCGVPLFDPWSD
jgi:predicted nucleic acid-binding protein